MAVFIQSKHSKGCSKMNGILAKLEEFNLNDLNYVLEYLTELMNERKRAAEREKRQRRKAKCKEKNLKQ